MRTSSSDPAAVLRRLYLAKLTELQLYSWRTHTERQQEAMDYAVSSLPGCRTNPLPLGGVGQLEDELRLELGIELGAARGTLW